MENEQIREIIKRKIKKIIIGIVLIFVLFFLNPLVKIDAGERGVLMNWGAVQDKILDEGIHLKIPIMQKIVKLDVKTQKMESIAISYSKDLQTATALIALNYHIDSKAANKLWQEIGRDYESRIIDPAIQEVLKQISSKYNAQELISKRQEVKEGLKISMTERLAPYHLLVDDISVKNFDFSDSYEKAIEEKQVAEQNAQKAENDLKRIQIEAQQKIEIAKAEAESIRIQADALKENQELVKLRAVEKWNGILPQYMLSNTIPFIDLNK